MDTKIKIYLVIALAILLPVLFTSKCTKNNDYKIPITLNFVYPITIYPATDSIYIGDTLWITFEINDSLYDNFTKKTYYLPNYDFKTYFSTEKISDLTKNLSEQEYATNKFNTYSVVGNIQIGGAFSIDFTPIYENHLYRFLGAIIPKDTGVYAIRVQNMSFGNRLPTTQLDLGKDKKGHQLLAEIGFINSLINNKNTNYNIFLQHCKSGNTSDPKEWKEENMTYTFVVK
jgi:hypothetical protein